MFKKNKLYREGVSNNWHEIRYWNPIRNGESYAYLYPGMETININIRKI